MKDNNVNQIKSIHQEFCKQQLTMYGKWQIRMYSFQQLRMSVFPD